jgi:hypothetical protein
MNMKNKFPDLPSTTTNLSAKNLEATSY